MCVCVCLSLSLSTSLCGRASMHVCDECELVASTITDLVEELKDFVGRI